MRNIHVCEDTRNHGVTYTKNTHIIRKDDAQHMQRIRINYYTQGLCVTYAKNTHNMHEEYAYHTQGLCITLTYAKNAYIIHTTCVKNTDIYHTQG